MRQSMKDKVSVGVLVSGGGTNLQAIIDAVNSGIIKSAKVELVISNNPGAYALTRAEKNSIKTRMGKEKGEGGGGLFNNVGERKRSSSGD